MTANEEKPVSFLWDVLQSIKRERRRTLRWLIAGPLIIMGMLTPPFLLSPPPAPARVISILLSALWAIVIGITLSILYIFENYYRWTYRSLKEAVYIVTFSTLPVRGETAGERLLNQVIGSDDYLSEAVKRHPDKLRKHLGGEVAGSSGKRYTLDLLLCIPPRLLQKTLFLGRGGILLVGKEFNIDGRIPASLLKEFKQGVEDLVKAFRVRLPYRVIALSPSGFEKDAFEYVNSREGAFHTSFPSAECWIELVHATPFKTYQILNP